MNGDLHGKVNDDNVTAGVIGRSLFRHWLCFPLRLVDKAKRDSTLAAEK